MKRSTPNFQSIFPFWKGSILVSSLALCAFAGGVLALPFYFENLFFLFFVGFIPLLKSIEWSRNKFCHLQIFVFLFSFKFCSILWFSSSIVHVLGIMLFALVFSAFITIVFSILFFLMATRLTKDIVFLFAFLLGGIVWQNSTVSDMAFSIQTVLVCSLLFVKLYGLFGSTIGLGIILAVNLFLKFFSKKRQLIFCSIAFCFHLLSINYQPFHNSIFQFSSNRLIGIVSSNFTNLQTKFLTKEQQIRTFIAENKCKNTSFYLFPETSLGKIDLEKLNSDSIIFSKRELEAFDSTSTYLIAGAVLDLGEKNRNISILITPENSKNEIVSKSKLIPLVEYDYFNIFSFIPNNFGFGSYLPGDKAEVFEINDGLKILPIICSESNYLYRLSFNVASSKPNFIVVQANEALFDFNMARNNFNRLVRLISIETGLPVYKSSNAGNSCFFSKDENICFDISKNNRFSINYVPMIEHANLSIYQRNFFIFAPVCILLCFLMIISVNAFRRM